MDCKSLTLGWISLSLYKVVVNSYRPLRSLCFLGWLEKQDGCLDLWLAETLLTSPLKPQNRIQRKLTGSKISTSSTRNSRWPSWPDWLRHFRLLLWNCWTEFKEIWQEARSQCPLPSLCFIEPIGNPRWPPWPLISWDIFYFFSETAERNTTWHNFIATWVPEASTQHHHYQHVLHSKRRCSGAWLWPSCFLSPCNSVGGI